MRPWRDLQTLDVERPWVLDAVLALALLAVALVAAGRTSPTVPPPQIGLAVLLTLAYSFRRTAPLTVLVIAGALVVTMIIAGFSTAAIGSGLFLVAYTVAAQRPRRVTVVAASYCAGVLAAVAIVSPARMTLEDAATNLALFAGAFAFGRTARATRIAARLQAESAALAKQVQQDKASRALSQQRLAIAREVHDVVGHSLAVIALQAGVGARLAEAQPAEAQRALLAIAERSRSALSEVRTFLDSMRTDAASATASSPGLDALPQLVADMSAAGITVATTSSGETWRLPPELDTTAYRVLQESLTNVVRHAATDRAWVSVRYDEDAVEVGVRDRGVGPAPGIPPGTAHAGMRERVAASGGTLTAGPAAEGGYEVVARLPRPEEDP